MAVICRFKFFHNVLQLSLEFTESGLQGFNFIYSAVIQQRIRQEVSQFVKDSGELSENLSLTTLDNFTWKQLFRKLEKGVPMLYGVMSAAVQKKRNDISYKM